MPFRHAISKEIKFLELSVGGGDNLHHYIDGMGQDGTGLELSQIVIQI